ncbi:MAG: hypothetical protein NVSMB6_20170 [Burkholderiaceae bacterium]
MNTITRRSKDDAHPTGVDGVKRTPDQRLWCLALALFAMGLSDCASAGPGPVSPSVVFNFNVPSDTHADLATGMRLSLLPGIGSGLGATANSAEISRYMTATLHNAGYQNSSVDVKGAIGTATYVGEGYVWGDSLGTKDGAVFNPKTAAHSPVMPKGRDGFIMNNNFGLYGEKVSPFFKMNFTNFVIDTVSYDWEIFPDSTCPTSRCSVLPDMTLFASGTKINSSNGEQIIAANETAQRFNAANYAPQNMGTLSNIAVDGAVGLRFNDWPAEIGIDNLTITGHAVPEPATLPLLAGGLLGLGWVARRRKNALNS